MIGESHPKRDPLLMDSLEAANVLRISTRTLHTLTKRGVIPCVRLGRRVLYRREALAHRMAELEALS